MKVDHVGRDEVQEHRVKAFSRFRFFVSFHVVSLVPETHLNGLPDKVLSTNQNICGCFGVCIRVCCLHRWWLKPWEDESCFHSSTDSWAYAFVDVTRNHTLRCLLDIYSLSHCCCYIKGIRLKSLFFLYDLRLSTKKRHKTFNNNDFGINSYAADRYQGGKFSGMNEKLLRREWRDINSSP